MDNTVFMCKYDYVRETLMTRSPLVFVAVQRQLRENAIDCYHRVRFMSQPVGLNQDRADFVPLR
jgi:hypothetical protein